MVLAVLRKAFPGKEDIVSQIYIAAWMGKEWRKIGKINHINRIWEMIGRDETKLPLRDEDSFSLFHDTSGFKY